MTYEILEDGRQLTVLLPCDAGGSYTVKNPAPDRLVLLEHGRAGDRYRFVLFAYRVSNATEQSFAELNRLEKQINEQGFDCKRAGKEDIKRFLSRYFGHVVEDTPDDVDGERMIRKWIIPD